MRSTRNLGFCFWLAVLFLVFSTAWGAFLQWKCDQTENESNDAKDRENLSKFIDDFDDEINAAPSEETLGRLPSEEMLARMPSVRIAAAVVGRFVWTPPKNGRERNDTLVWREGLSDAMASNVAARTMWLQWTANAFSHGAKSAKLRGLTPLEETPYRVLWSRAGDRLYGVVFEDYPLERASRPKTWHVVSLAVTLLLLALGYFFVLKVAETREREANALKTRFLDCVSHELKTPCASIQLWAGMLASGRLDEKPEARASAYTYILDSNSRMIRLVERLLDAVHLEKNSYPVEMAPVEIVALLLQVVEETRGSFGERELSFANEADAAWCVDTDADAVKQIVYNLLSNARKYAPDGPVEVILSKTDAGGPRIRVLDRGPGMSKKARTKAFERFYREHDGLTSDEGGLGLGLTISLGLARQLGGNLTLAARPGGGCEFTLTLPLAPTRQS